MLRKTLTILSLIGLLLSVAAWWISYHDRPAVRSSEYFATLSSGTLAYVTEYWIDYYWGTEDSDSFRWRHRSIVSWSWMPVARRSVWGFEFHLPLYLPSVLFALPCIWSVYCWYRESLIQQHHLEHFKLLAIITYSVAFVIMITGIVTVREYGMTALVVLAVSISLIFGREWVRETKERRLCLYTLAFLIMAQGIVRDREYGLMALAVLALSFSLIIGPEWVSERKARGLCLRCGYDLRGSKDRCPECGQEFDRSCFAKL